MEVMENEEPIYELAIECETLFAQQLTRLQDENEPNGAKVLSELSQRFAAWTAFLGVFSEPNLSLDRRLRRHVDIQDQVLRLLDIMLRNLTHLFDRDYYPDRIQVGASDTGEALRQILCISIDSLNAVSGAIERLNHLGTSIRQSSVTNQVTKARKFADRFDLASFEGVAYLSMKTLYPDARVELLDQLTQSMTETYTRFLYRKHRQEQLQAPRPRPRATIPLSAISEEPGGEDDIGSALDNQIKLRQGGERFSTRGLQRPALHTLPISAPTSVNSQEFKKRFRDTFSSRINDKTMSLLVDQVEYPQPSKEGLTCEWCFSPLPNDSFERANWRRHVNEDHEPYVCISESCCGMLVRFPTSTQWLEHMTTAHGSLWHREVHMPASWACPLCSDDDSTFPGPNDLNRHIETLHAGIFTVSQTQAIVRQSRFRSSRAQGICPLCCLSVKYKRDSLSNETADSKGCPFSDQLNSQASQEHTKKRIKTGAGCKPLNQNHESIPKSTNKHRDSAIHDGPPSSNNSSSEVIASHVAAHLQGIMLLTLRLISTDVAMDISADCQSTSGSTDDQSSFLGSRARSSDLNMDILEDFPPQREGASEPEHEVFSDVIVPDCEDIDWRDVPRRYEVPPEPVLEYKAEGGGAFGQSGDQSLLGRDLEEFISNYPTAEPSDKDSLGQDLEEFISHPPMGAPPGQDYLGWDIEEFISNHPTPALEGKDDLGQNLEEFISSALHELEAKQN